MASPRAVLSDEDAQFAVCRDLGHDRRLEAYKRIFPERAKEANDEELRKEIKNFFDRPAINAFLEWSALPPKERAKDVMDDQVLFGSKRDQRDAAKIVLGLEEKNAEKLAVKRWATIMKEIGAEVVVPVGPGKEEVYPFKDLIDG